MSSAGRLDDAGLCPRLLKVAPKGAKRYLQHPLLGQSREGSLGRLVPSLERQVTQAAVPPMPHTTRTTFKNQRIVLELLPCDVLVTR